VRAADLHQTITSLTPIIPDEQRVRIVARRKEIMSTDDIVFARVST
jgi:hypothetical protein